MCWKRTHEDAVALSAENISADSDNYRAHLLMPAVPNRGRLAGQDSHFGQLFLNR